MVALNGAIREVITMRWLWLSILLLISSCDRRQPAPSPPPPIPVASATYAVAEIAKQIGGDDVAIDWVIEKPAIIAQYQPTDVDRQRLMRSELLIVAGPIDAWVLVNKGSVQRERGLVRMNLLPGVTESSGATWLDPDAAIALADELPKLLYSRRPDHQQQFSDAAERWKKSLAEMRSEIEPTIAAAAGKSVGTLSPIFDALLLRYGLAPVRLADADLHQLSDQDLFRLKQAAAAQSVQWLVVDASIPDSLVQWVATKTGLKVLRLETAGSSAPSSGISTYLEVCRYNLQQLCRLTTE